MMRPNKVENPYAISDDEWSVAYIQFKKFCLWLAKATCKAMRVPSGNQDAREDLFQEFIMTLLGLMSKYKRQVYVTSAIRWFERNPDHIPMGFINDVGYAMHCWRFRGSLGATHGFHPIHDTVLSAAMDVVVAPVDFRWESKDECARFLSSVRPEVVALLTKKELCVYERYRSATSQERWARPSEEDQVAMNDMRSKLSDLEPKPCRARPFFMDANFHPYAKRVLINHGNKMMARQQRPDGSGYVDIDSLGDAIADTRPSAMNEYVRKNDQRFRSKWVDRDTFNLPTEQHDLVDIHDVDGNVISAF
jgi:hypothetical protein